MSDKMTDQYLDEDDHEGIAALLTGKSIVNVLDDKIKLDDGTIVQVVPNEGCACGAGDYTLSQLNEVPNIITKVSVESEGNEVEAEPGSLGWEIEHETTYKIFVWSQNVKLLAVEVEGSDGNGYYGTGFTLHVRKAKP